MEIKELMSFIEIFGQKLEEEFGIVDDKEKLILSSALKITEELGELSNEIMATFARQRKEKTENMKTDNLPNEFADVLIAILMLARDMNVDVEKALKNKTNKIKTRFNIN